MEMLGSLQRITVAVLGITVLSFVMVLDARAEFAMNFQPAPSGLHVGNVANVDCRDPLSASTTNPSDPCIRGGYEGTYLGNPKLDPDKTPFFQEMVSGTDSDYYHIIVGDPASGFAAEYFIKITTWNGANYGCYFSGAFCTASSGAALNGGTDTFQNSSLYRADPLSTASPTSSYLGSGNGTANPERVIYRQFIQDTEMLQETLKATLATKPVIEQTITENIVINPDHSYTVVDPTKSSLISSFTSDMSTIGYHDLSSSALITNQTVLIDPSNPGSDLGNWDMAANAQQTHINGGQYIYNPGGGYNGARGNYTYSEGDLYDIYAIEWSLYSDPNNVPNTP